jgi:hypothetical protein
MAAPLAAPYSSFKLRRACEFNQEGDLCTSDYNDALLLLTKGFSGCTLACEAPLMLIPDELIA